MSEINAIRGMTDILPQDSVVWRTLEREIADSLAAFGYGEIRLPLVERTALFSRSIGEVTDIVEKEMYSFEDRNGDSLTLRPEGTAGCVRAAIQQGLLSTTQRLWYMGPMFRYERPQKGRQRQFHQVGAEAFGVATPDMDAEVIALTAKLWSRLGIGAGLELQLNSIGSTAARAAYKAALTDYLRQHVEALDEDSQRRLETNPLRILDSKNTATQAVLDGAPSLAEYLDDESKSDFDRLCELLQAAGIPFTLNPRLVRGLDYYNKTVFEWVTDQLGAQGTVCAGGRYDGLVKQLGGRDTPAVGFAIGMERLVLLVREAGLAVDAPAVDVYCVAVGAAAESTALATLGSLRDALPGRVIVLHTGGGSFKSQLKRADKSNASIALIWGQDEVDAQTVNVKILRGEGGQQSVPLSDLAPTLKGLLEPAA